MRKFLTLLLSTCIALVSGCLLVSCGNESEQSEQPKHICELVLQQEQLPTCTQSGIKAHYTCTGCNKLFEDPTGTMEITADALVLPASHAYTEQGICSVCGDHTCSYGEWQEGVAATCTQMGRKGYQQCLLCFEYFDEKYQIITDFNLPIDPKAHDVGEWMEEIAPTCRYTGVKGHYECSACLQNVDEQLNVIDDVVLPVDGSLHNYIYNEGSAVTCETDGMMNYYHCDGCYSLFDEDKNLFTGDTILYATGHSWANGECGTCGCAYYTQGLTYVYAYNTEYQIGGWKVSLGDCMETEIVVPAQYKDQPVVFMGDFSYSGIESISLPESILDISYGALQGCESLTQVMGGNGLIRLYNYAFAGCGNLRTIGSMPNAESVGEYAFENCASLESVAFGNDLIYLGEYAFYGCSSLQSVALGNCLDKIYNDTFSGCCSLELVDLPDSLTEIGSSAFYNCEKLTIDAIPSGITLIDSGVFCGCLALTQVNIPQDVQYIYKNAFRNCSSLTSVVFDGESSLLAIYENAFYGCASLKDISLPNGLEEIKNYAFAESGLTEIVIPDSVTKFGEGTMNFIGHVFYCCDNLQSVVVGNGITEIKWNTFAVCPSLISVKLGDGVKAIGDSAFFACPSLQTVIVGNAIEFIAENAFWDCNLDQMNYNVTQGGLYWGNENNPYVVLVQAENLNSITEFSAHEDTRYVFNAALCNALSLSTVTLGEKIVAIGVDAFSLCKQLQNVYYNGDITAWLQIDFADEESNPLSNGARLYIDEALVTRVVVPEVITEIGAYAFYGYQNLETLICHDNVEIIGYNAFVNCSNLKEITLPSSLTPNSDTLCFSGTAVTEFTVPEGISYFYLADCKNLQTLTLSDTVLGISYNALYGCTALVEIYYSGTMAQWQKVMQNTYDNWDKDVPATQVVCSDGTVAI